MLQAHKALKVYKEILEQMERKDLLVKMEFKEHKEIKVGKDHKDIKGHKVIKEFKERLCKAPRERLDSREIEVFKGNR
jgi:hypothetical protein